MFFRHSVFLVAVFAVLFFSYTPAAANDSASTEYLVLDVGGFRAQDRELPHTEEESAVFGISYKAQDIGFDFAPILGVRATGADTYYAYAGMSWNPHIMNSFVFSPSFSVVAYEKGSGPDLGGVLEFLSQFEVAYEFEDKNRLGVAYAHISNANIHETNPGYDSFMLVYSHPINLLGELY